MALIPTDVGVNLRTQVDTPLRPTAPVSEIPSDLPDLKQGQLFSARIVDVLPDATYKALVAGKSITLSLPGGAKAGDTLELVVVDKTSKMVMARLADAALSGSQEGEAYPHATFSPTAQLIGKLLSADGEPARPVALNQGEPLLPAAPAKDDPEIAARLTPQLEKAVTQSGMFYEAHQAKWIAGQLPTQALLEEPQNQLQRTPATERPVEAKEPVTIGSFLQALLGKEKGPEATVGGGPASGVAAGQNNPAERTTTNAPPLQPGLAPVVPDDLRHLVQQQLDAAATQRMVWHGEVWPNQPMDWEIQRDSRRQQGGDMPDEDRWTTRLALTTPRLGRVEAKLELRPTGVQISLQVGDGQSMETLQQGVPALSQSLEAAGVPAMAIRVWQRPQGQDESGS